MSGKRVVIHKLLSLATVTAIVGTKIGANKAEQAWPPPFIVVTGPGEENRQLLTADAEYPRSRIRIECLASSPMAASTLRNAAFNGLKNVTNELITDGFSPADFAAMATIIPADFSADGYSDMRDADSEIFDVYVDWREA